VSWARLDDMMPDKAKVRHVGPLGLALHVAGICYAARNLTDGFIPDSAVPTLLDLPARQLKALVAKMQEVAPRQEHPLWHRVEGGYEVHDYLEYNPNRASVLAEREKAKQRMFGKRSGEVPANKGRTSPSPDPVPDPLLVETPYVTTQESDPLRKPTNVLDRTFGQGSDREDLERALDEEWKLDYLKEHPEGIRMTPEEIKRGRIDLRARRKGSAAAVG